MHLFAGCPAGTEIVFLACEHYEKLELLVIHTSLGHCAELLFRHNWRKLVTLLFLFILLVKIVVWLIGACFFLLWVRFPFEVFSYCTFTKTLAFVFQNSIDQEWFFLDYFWWNVLRFNVVISAWTEIFNNCSIVFFFWRYPVFSMVSLRGILVCSLKVLVQHRIF